MSVLGLIDRNQIDAGPGGIEAPSTTVQDVFTSSLEANARNFGIGAKALFSADEFHDNKTKYEELTGRNIYTDSFDASPDKEELYKAYLSNKDTDRVNQAIDQHVTELKEKDPEKYKDLRTSADVNATVKEKAKASLAQQGKDIAGATTAASFAGQIGGGLVAGFVDPVNLATIPLGAGMASGILKTALIEAGINAGAEVASYPFVKKWQEELGQEYGASELLENAGMAALFGGALGGGGKILKYGIDKLNLPNSTKLAELRPLIEERGNIEGVQAARHEERRLQIQEADPSRYNPDVGPEIQARALEEVDVAINEGRQVRADNAGLTDQQVRSLNPEKMDDGLKEFHKLITEESPELQASKKAPNEIFETPHVEPSPLSRQQEITELHDTPEYKAAERANFERQIDQVDPEALIYLDREGEVMSVKELRESFADDKAYMDAISSCGIGGEE